MKQFPITVLLLASIAAMFGVELARGALGDDAKLLALGAVRDSGGLRGEYWRLLAYGWLHAGWVHLLLNLSLIYWTGRIVERRIGSAQTLAVFLFAVLCGGIGHSIRAAYLPKSGVTLGASAGCFALLGCAIVLLARPAAARFGQPRRTRHALAGIAGAGLAISFIPGVSLVGHAIGLVVGLAAGFLARLSPGEESPAPASPVS